MKVIDLMHTDLTVVDADTTVAEAVVTLADEHISALPVLDNRKRLIGVVSTADILQAEADAGSAEERDQLFEETTVRDIMTSQPVTISPEVDVREAAQRMLYLDVHRLFVEEKGRLAGVISQSDVVRAVATAKI